VASPSLPPPGDADIDADICEPTATRRWTPLRVVLLIAIIGIVAMWVYIFSGLARGRSPDSLDDTTVPPRAEAICAPVFTELEKPNPSRPADAPGRAAEVERSTARLARMVDELQLLTPAADRDHRIYGEWISDWRTYIGNRNDFARRLRADATARLYVAQKGAKQITEPIDGFAKSNRMPSCTTPSDLF
jgi:hypothetical protein